MIIGYLDPKALRESMDYQGRLGKTLRSSELHEHV